MVIVKVSCFYVIIFEQKNELLTCFQLNHILRYIFVRFYCEKERIFWWNPWWNWWNKKKEWWTFSKEIFDFYLPNLLAHLNLEHIYIHAFEFNHLWNVEISIIAHRWVSISSQFVITTLISIISCRS